jgi:hypothetical protein
MGIFARLGIKDFVMAITACVSSEMKFVIEQNGTKFRYLDRNLVYNMTAYTLRNMERSGLVVAEAAGFPFFHFSHRNGGVLFAYFINGIVADSTVIGKL